MTEQEIEIHILDDSKDDLELIELFLGENEDLRPYFLHSSSPKFMERFRALKFGVMVMDYKLSEGPDGLQLMKELQEEDEDECFYKIIQTGYPDISMMLDFLKLRPDDFVIKKDAHDGKGHYPDLMDALRKGKAKTMRRIEKEKKRNEEIRKLLEMAEAIGQQVLPYQQDHIQNVDKTLNPK